MKQEQLHVLHVLLDQIQILLIPPVIFVCQAVILRQPVYNHVCIVRPGNTSKDMETPIVSSACQGHFHLAKDGVVVACVTGAHLTI